MAGRGVHPCGGILGMETWSKQVFSRKLEGAGCGSKRVGAVVLLGVFDPRPARLLYHIRHANFCAVFQPASGLGDGVGGRSTVHLALPRMLAHGCALCTRPFPSKDLERTGSGMELCLFEFDRSEPPNRASDV